MDRRTAVLNVFLYLLRNMSDRLPTSLKFLLTACFIGLASLLQAQDGFVLEEGKVKSKVEFELVNNLVVIPVEVNGKELSFLLDTGVNYTLLFSLSDTDSLEINNVSPVKIKGLGGGGDIQALKSLNNQVKIGDATDADHTIFVIFDQRINFSPRMGIPVHGVIGYDFFKNFVVRTEYKSEVLTFYDPESYGTKNCKSCANFDLRLFQGKPYVELLAGTPHRTEKVTLLVDSGASDALWLFDEAIGIKEDPPNYFEDFLGLGLSGGVFGKRSKLPYVTLGKYRLERVNVSYPDSLALKNLETFAERDGTLGSDILRRFTVVMDYPGRKMSLKRNRYFNDPFHYNMAGITLEHDGVIPVKDVVEGTGRSFKLDGNTSEATSGGVRITIAPVFKFFLAPKFVVAEVREGSPAHEAGIKQGDEVTQINNQPAYRYSLAEVAELFSSKAGRKVMIEIDREGNRMKKRLILKEVL